VAKSGYLSRTLYHKVERQVDPATGRQYDLRNVALVPYWTYSSYGYDSDLDGLSNYEELLLGTAPQNNDTDADGLYDGWEVYGHNWVDYPALGADPLHKDIFLELDYHAAVKPSQAVLTKLTELWATLDIPNPDGVQGIALHPILDDVLPETNAQGAEYDCKTDHYDVWDRDTRTGWPYFDAIHRGGFYYGQVCLGPLKSDGSRQTGGGGWEGGFYIKISPTNSDPDDDMTERMQHSYYQMIAHELGHAVGLLHGGYEGMPCKPNYHSVMNGEAYTEVSWGGTNTLAGSRMDYSRGEFVGFPLDETALHEYPALPGLPASARNVLTFFGVNTPTRPTDVNPIKTGFRVSGSWIDWNGDSSYAGTPIAFDITNAGSECATPVRLQFLEDAIDSDIIRAALPVNVKSRAPFDGPHPAFPFKTPTAPPEPCMTEVL